MAPSLKEIIVALAMFHCAMQGILVPLLIKFFTSSYEKRTWFKVYVSCVNLVVFAQTIFRIVQGFQALCPSLPSLLAIPFLTVFISSSVQAFFLFRCWNIFKRRLLPLVPYLVLWLACIVFGLMASSGLIKASGVFPSQAITVIGWVTSWFLLDLMITVTTIVYLYRYKTDLREHDGAFSIVWQVVWASAAPPLVLMFLTMAGQLVVSETMRIIPIEQGFALEQISIGMSEKMFALSLMITIVGRGYIREKLDRAAPRPSLPSFTLRRSQEISEPVFLGENSGAYELQMPTGSMSPPASTFAQAPSEIDVHEHEKPGSKAQDL